MASKPVAKAQHGLKRKIGPAPLYAWLIAAVIGFVVWRHYKAKSGAQASSQAAAVQVPASGQLNPDGSFAYGGGAPSGGGGMGLPQNLLNPDTPTPGPGTTTPPATTPTTPNTQFPTNNQPSANDPAGVMSQNQKRWIAAHPSVPPASSANGTVTGTSTGAVH